MKRCSTSLAIRESTWKETERETTRQRETETDKETQRKTETERHTDLLLDLMTGRHPFYKAV